MPFTDMGFFANKSWYSEEQFYNIKIQQFTVMDFTTAKIRIPQKTIMLIDGGSASGRSLTNPCTLTVEGPVRHWCTTPNRGSKAVEAWYLSGNISALDHTGLEFEGKLSAGLDLRPRLPGRWRIARDLPSRVLESATWQRVVGARFPVLVFCPSLGETNWDRPKFSDLVWLTWAT